MKQLTKEQKLEDTELWAHLPGFEGKYDVSTYGNLRCWYMHKAKLNIPFMMKLCVNQVGYISYMFQWFGKRQSWQIHRLVLTVFDGPCPPGMECRHLDGNPLNNRLSNLKWGTHTENMADTILHGTKPAGPSHGRSKLKEEQVMQVKGMYDSGMLQYEIAERLGVTPGIINGIISGKIWVSTTGIKFISRKSLTGESVKDIRKLFATGFYTIRSLGKKFDQHEWTISRIVKRRTWKDV